LIEEIRYWEWKVWSRSQKSSQETLSKNSPDCSKIWATGNRF